MAGQRGPLLPASPLTRTGTGRGGRGPMAPARGSPLRRPGHLIVRRGVSSSGWTRAGRGRPGGARGCPQRPPLPLSRSSGFPGCVRILNKKGKARPKLIFQRREETLFPASYKTGAKQTDTGAIVPLTMWRGGGGGGGAREGGRGSPGRLIFPGAHARCGALVARAPCAHHGRAEAGPSRPGPSEGRTGRAAAGDAARGERGRGGRLGAPRGHPRGSFPVPQRPGPRARGVQSSPPPRGAGDSGRTRARPRGQGLPPGTGGQRAPCTGLEGARGGTHASGASPAPAGGGGTVRAGGARR